MGSRRIVFAASCAGMLLFGIVMISLGSVLPALTSKFVLDEVAAGSLASLLPFGILAGSVVFGPIVDGYGYKTLLIACTLLVFVSLEGIALTTSFAVLQASVFVIGFGGGVLNGATNALVSDISSDGRGAGLSFLGAFFGIGALGMPLILGLLSKHFSQGSILAIIGAFVFLFSLFFATVRFPVPKQPQGFPLARGVSLLKDATLLLFGCILFFESGMEGVVNNWTTTFLQHNGTASSEGALFALSCQVGGLAVARLILSRVLKRFSMWSVLFTGTAIIGAGVLLLMWGGGYPTAIIGLVLMGIGFAPVFPLVLGAVGDVYAALSGTAFSIALVIALIGNMGLNYLVGLVAHHHGIRQFPGLVLASLFLMVVLLLVTKRRLAAAGRIHHHA
jgi:MFS transporter, FHS family, glucose/mannose:H+ symporter